MILINKQTNKNICHICNYRKQYKYNSHKCKWYHETDSNHLKRYDRRKVQTIQKRLQLQTSQTFSPGLSVNVLELPWWRRDRIWTDILQSVVFCWIFLKKIIKPKYTNALIYTCFHCFCNVTTYKSEKFRISEGPWIEIGF